MPTSSVLPHLSEGVSLRGCRVKTGRRVSQEGILAEAPLGGQAVIKQQFITSRGVNTTCIAFAASQQALGQRDHSVSLVISLPSYLMLSVIVPRTESERCQLLFLSLFLLSLFCFPGNKKNQESEFPLLHYLISDLCFRRCFPASR